MVFLLVCYTQILSLFLSVESMSLPLQKLINSLLTTHAVSQSHCTLRLSKLNTRAGRFACAALKNFTPRNSDCSYARTGRRSNSCWTFHFPLFDAHTWTMFFGLTAVFLKKKFM